MVGDGDFLMTVQELGVVAQHGIPVCFVVANNQGYMSIRGGQRKITDRHVISEFSRADGSPYGVDVADVARGFGVTSWRVESSDDLEPTLKKAISADEPTVVEVPTARDAAGPWVPGWWDFPIPTYIDDERQKEYREMRGREQHL